MITRRQMLGGIGTVAAASVAISMLGVKPLAARNAEYTGKTHGADYFTNVVLTNQNGDQVKFYDDLIKNKFVVINMMYASVAKVSAPLAPITCGRYKRHWVIVSGATFSCIPLRCCQILIRRKCLKNMR